MKPDDDFLDDLAEGHRRQSRFAAICREHGIAIFVSPLVVRPDASQRFDYSDDGDLMVHLRVEHKGRGVAFSDRDSFPFESVIVDEVYKVDRIRHRPCWFVTESSDGAAVAVISSRTQSQWGRMRRFDKYQQRECDYYVCPKGLVRFCRPEEVF